MPYATIEISKGFKLEPELLSRPSFLNYTNLLDFRPPSVIDLIKVAKKP